MTLTHKDVDGLENKFQCNEVTNSKQVAFLINMPVKDTGSRYITDSDINFVIDETIIVAGEVKRITGIPELKPKVDNNSRRGIYRKDKVLVTT
jgi:hypothetical protein